MCIKMLDQTRKQAILHILAVPWHQIYQVYVFCLHTSTVLTLLSFLNAASDIFTIGTYICIFCISLSLLEHLFSYNEFGIMTSCAKIHRVSQSYISINGNPMRTLLLANMHMPWYVVIQWMQSSTNTKQSVLQYQSWLLLVTFVM